MLTCPVCSQKAYRALLYLEIEEQSQYDLFEEGGGVSVSALDELNSYETELRRSAPIVDGLPF